MAYDAPSGGGGAPASCSVTKEKAEEAQERHIYRRKKVVSARVDRHLVRCWVAESTAIKATTEALYEAL